jgi:putative DeoR family transcriptional regulator (stage III sporulation protein D)
MYQTQVRLRYIMTTSDLYPGREKERCELLAEYIIEYEATVRLAAARFGIGKSTVHKDVTSTLREINPRLYEKAREVLDRNKAERHIRGGEATRRRFLMRKKLENKK